METFFCDSDKNLLLYNVARVFLPQASRHKVEIEYRHVQAILILYIGDLRVQ